MNPVNVKKILLPEVREQKLKRRRKNGPGLELVILFVSGQKNHWFLDKKSVPMGTLCIIN